MLRLYDLGKMKNRFDEQLIIIKYYCKSIRVKRFGLFGGYNPYMNSSPYTYKVKTPFFKVKVKSNQGNFYGHPPYGFGGFYPPFGAGAFHPQPSIPYGYQHNPHGYGWFG
ncbi:unnamed protein product [Onchocerca ochengi]|uniref:Uncharacterized protein n=1 Tax=Onchocerca ochengi TaxID=42157 RepID=A0A182E210_ONCOC|nr:unnamed protein product [Onchocerca ochengi]